MSPPFDVVCLGLATTDTIVVMSSWPERDGRLLAERIVHAGGGPAASAAVTIAALGGSVALAAAVGDDDIGPVVRAQLDASGVDVAGVISLRGSTAESVILVDRSASTRTILHAPGVTLAELDEATRSRCGAAAWVHVDHAGYPLAADVERSRLSVDAGNPIPDLDLEGIGLYAPTAAGLCERYPGHEPPDAMRLALADGARSVVVTLGGRGAMAADATGAWRVGAAEVAVESTLGAGDVFHGALVASLASGRSLADALRRANVAAALSCRAIDARSSIPTLAELEVALATAPPVEPIQLEPHA